MIETLLTIGVLGISATMAVPMYRQYIIRNDLEIARQNISQGIQRAKYLSQVSMNDSAWGFSTDAVPGRGIIFMGQSFATRNSDFDELYSVPSTIAISGVTEVSFEKITGHPSTSGIITLTAINGEQRTVSIAIGDEGTVSIPEDWLTICMDPYGSNPQSVQVPDSIWQYYSEQGALMGVCGANSSSAGSSSSTQSINFIVNNDTIDPDNDYTCVITVLGAELTDAGAYDMPITMRWKFGGGAGWEEPFGDMSSPTQANVNSESQAFQYACNSYASTLEINADVQAWKKKKYWYSGEEDSHWVKHTNVHTISGNNDFVEVYTDGDTKPSHSSFDNPGTVEDFLAPYVDFSTDVMSIPGNSALFIFELNSTNLSQDPGDFQDLAVLLEIIDT